MASLEKLNNVHIGQKDLKYNIERELETIQDHLKDTKDKIGELNKKIINLELGSNQDGVRGGAIGQGISIIGSAKQSSRE